ncbi:Hypp9395 [Branchiostoma lanceolatum]|uniref:Hypp9395 protein n=1 Tax=Branchiostoma lanceolatum TaxID=7740 RepID=A0A8S4MLN4_BRALA|nr:Hypp9395 [Branchiostoma lanceolatum]
MAQDLVRDGAVTIMGDGRCDSPGYCAKYCSYTVMEEKTALILDMKLVQVTETGTSLSMEKEGLQRCLTELDDNGIEIECLATDRHRGIAAMMKKDYKDIKRRVDLLSSSARDPRSPGKYRICTTYAVHDVSASCKFPCS